MSNITFEELVKLVARLRAPDGCPWDREQTYETVGPMTIEEAYEVLEAIEAQDVEAMCHELGDLLLHVVFYSQMAAERGDFSVGDVISHIYNKMIRRHPHVFGETSASTPAEVLRNWEVIKAEEKAAVSADEPAALLEGVSTKLPALLEAMQLTARASRVGFDWARAAEVMQKVEEELRELKEAMVKQPEGKAAVKEEIGDLLFAVVNLARHLEIDAELALRKVNRKFKERFRHIELELRRQGRTLQEATLAEMDALWEQAKREEAPLEKSQ